MRTPLERIRRGAIVLGAIFVIAVVGYHFAGYDWVESIWLVVVTISSVGFSEHSSHSPMLQMFSVAVIVFGMSAAVYTFGGFIQMLTEGEIERAMGRRRMTRDIEKLSDHIVICGYGRMGEILAEDLLRHRQKFVIVDHDQERIVEAQDNGFLCLLGDANEDEVLINAGVKRAKALVTGLPNDAANVFITLTTRNLSSHIQIIARAEHKSSDQKLRQAGANKVVMPANIGARRMVRMITRPLTADLMEQVVETSYLDVELDEILVPEENKLIGVSVRETEAGQRHHLLVVAINHADGKLLFNPEADYTFQIGDVVILMGRSEDIKRFRGEYGL